MIEPEAIRGKAAEYRDETARLLSDLIKIRSLSGDEEALARRIKTVCEEYEFDEVRIDGLGSVVARIGTGARTVAFDAHIDTVDVGDPAQWDRDPFSGEIEGGVVFGRGASDQKGGAAAMIAAGRILKEFGCPRDRSVYMIFTVMEEDCDGMCWKYLIEEEGLRPDVVVSTEPTSCRITRGQRGRMEIALRIKGVSAHGSAPERGKSAAYKAARAALALERFNETLPADDDGFLGKGSIVVSQIEVHGPSKCAVPDQAMLYLDRRLTWGENADEAMAEIKEIVADATGDDEAAIEVEMPDYDKRGWKNTDYTQELYFPTWKIAEDASIVLAGVRTYERLWHGKPEVGRWTFSTNLVATTGRHGIPAIGFGPGDEDQAHAPNEMTRIDDLEVCTSFYAMLPYVLESKE